MSKKSSDNVEEKSIPMSEVEKHVTKDDCWLVVGGRVYNVTKFLNDHPGGPSLLLDNTARDCLDEFDAIGHTRTSRVMMKEKYYIGNVEACKDLISWKTFIGEAAPPTSSATVALFLIPVLLVVAAVIIKALGIKIEGLPF